MITIDDAITISDEEILEEMDRMRPSHQQQFGEMDSTLRDAQLMEWAKENLIERKLIQYEATRQIEEVTEDEIQQVLRELAGGVNGGKEITDEMRAQAVLSVKVQKLLEEITEKGLDPSESEITEYYEAHKANYLRPEMVHAAHIVKHPESADAVPEVRAALEEALEKIEAGATFEAVAKEYTECPPAEVDLGFFPRGRMVEPFEAVVFNLEPGGVSGVFETQFGLHIATVYEHQDPAPLPLAEVAERVRQDMVQDRQQAAIEDYLDELKSGADITSQ